MILMAVLASLTLALVAVRTERVASVILPRIINGSNAEYLVEILHLLDE